MIQFGYCTSSSASDGDPLGLSVVPELIKNGFDFIELPVIFLMGLSDEDFNNAIVQIKSYTIQCHSCNILFPGSIKLTGMNVSIEAIESYMNSVIQRISGLGVEIIVFGSSGSRNVEEGFCKDTALEQLRDFLILASSMLKPYGIKIAIEALNKKETNILNNLTEAAQLAKMVNRDNVGVLIDIYHMDMENEPVDVIRELYKNGTNFIHAHIADAMNGRGFPLEKERFIDFANVLKAINYSGKLSIEGSSRNFDVDIVKAKAVLDSLFN